MPIDPDQILGVLDRCCDDFTFPMLDNGYFYLAATRLSLYRAISEWAIVIETFGFSPRSGIPDNCIYTFASNICNRKVPESYGRGELYERYLANNPNNEMTFVNPFEWDQWEKLPIADEAIGKSALDYCLRGQVRAIPSLKEYESRGIVLEDPSRVQVFEFCRMIAEVAREDVLATPEERRINVPADVEQILQLEEWNHPNVVDANVRPSGSETFQQLAQVLATGDVKRYAPSLTPNTHWRNWPDGGSI